MSLTVSKNTKEVERFTCNDDQDVKSELNVNEGGDGRKGDTVDNDVG